MTSVGAEGCPWDEGVFAAQRGEPRSACPWSPSTNEGIDWCRGWAMAEADRRPGMLADTLAMRRQANEQARAWDHAYRPDPVAAILGVEEATPDILTAVAAFTDVMQGVAEVVMKSARQIVETFQPLLDAIEEQDSRPHRRHGWAASCPRHGLTTGGLCRSCARGRRDRANAPNRG